VNHIPGLSETSFASIAISCLVTHIKYRLNAPSFDPLDDVAMWKALSIVLLMAKKEKVSINSSKHGAVLVKVLLRLLAQGSSKDLMVLVKETFTALLSSIDNTGGTALHQLNFDGVKDIVSALNMNGNKEIVHLLAPSVLEVIRMIFTQNVTVNPRSLFETVVGGILIQIVIMRNRFIEFSAAIDTVAFDVIFNDVHLEGFRDGLLAIRKVTGSSSATGEPAESGDGGHQQSRSQKKKKLNGSSSVDTTPISYQGKLIEQLRLCSNDSKSSKDVAQFLPVLMDAFIRRVVSFRSREVSKAETVATSLDEKKRKNDKVHSSVLSLEFCMLWELLDIASKYVQENLSDSSNRASFIHSQALLLQVASNYDFCQPNVDNTFGIVKKSLSLYMSERVKHIAVESRECIGEVAFLLECMLKVNYSFLEDNLVAIISWTFEAITHAKASEGRDTDLSRCVSFLSHLIGTYSKLRQVENLLKLFFKVIRINNDISAPVFTIDAILSSISNAVQDTPVGAVSKLMDALAEELNITGATAGASASLATSVNIVGFVYLHLPLDGFTAPKILTLTTQYATTIVAPLMAPFLKQSNAGDARVLSSAFDLLFSLIDLKCRASAWIPATLVDASTPSHLPSFLNDSDGKSLTTSAFSKAVTGRKESYALQLSFMKICVQRIQQLKSFIVMFPLENSLVSEATKEIESCSQYIWSQCEGLEDFPSDLAFVITESLPYLNKNESALLSYCKWLIANPSKATGASSGSGDSRFDARNAALAYAPFYEIDAVRSPLGASLVSKINTLVVKGFSVNKEKKSKAVGQLSTLIDGSYTDLRALSFHVADSDSVDDCIWSLTLLDALPIGFILPTHVESIMTLLIKSFHIAMNVASSKAQPSTPASVFLLRVATVLLKYAKVRVHYLLDQIDHTFLLTLIESPIAEFRQVATLCIQASLHNDYCESSVVFKLIHIWDSMKSIKFHTLSILLSAIVGSFTEAETACSKYNAATSEGERPSFAIPADLSNQLAILYSACNFNESVRDTLTDVYADGLRCFSLFMDYFRLETSEYVVRGDLHFTSPSNILSNLDHFLCLVQKSIIATTSSGENMAVDERGMIESTFLLALSKCFRRFKSSSFNEKKFEKVIALNLCACRIFSDRSGMNRVHNILFESWEWFSRNASSPQFILLLRMLHNEGTNFIVNPLDERYIYRAATMLELLKVTTSTVSDNSTGKRYQAFTKSAPHLFTLMTEVINVSAQLPSRTMADTHSTIDAAARSIFVSACEVVTLMIQRKKLIDINTKDMTLLLQALASVGTNTTAPVPASVGITTGKSARNAKKEVLVHASISAAVFESICPLLCALLNHRGKTIALCIPAFNYVITLLLTAVMRNAVIYPDGNTKYSVACAESLSRVYEGMVEQKAAFRRHVPYLLSEYVTLEAASSVSKELKRCLRGGANFLFDLASKHELQQLHAALPAAEKSLLKTLHRSYDDHHKYRGMV
jgi:hypothetical protein